ncbi:hypothetical protein EJ04DRAFT_168173 [Polyplosphaeria fusca]|uniref:Uncharacterized protein n=1 Tax=Polyplosphaeria fusca TaxID=682080 RepID=A0A9P4R8C8_9PLEO|nr:hypothetical protein EJ04DRAFT_168173 [Polyplosphaeria fusca]
MTSSCRSTGPEVPIVQQDAQSQRRVFASRRSIIYFPPPKLDLITRSASIFNLKPSNPSPRLPSNKSRIPRIPAFHESQHVRHLSTQPQHKSTRLRASPCPLARPQLARLTRCVTLVHRASQTLPLLPRHATKRDQGQCVPRRRAASAVLIRRARAQVPMARVTHGEPFTGI